jgi:hypothetical protein
MGASHEISFSFEINNSFNENSSPTNKKLKKKRKKKKEKKRKSMANVSHFPENFIAPTYLLNSQATFMFIYLLLLFFYYLSAQEKKKRDLNDFIRYSLQSIELSFEIFFLFKHNNSSLIYLNQIIYS